MLTDELAHTLTGIICVAVFAVTFLMGDIVGLAIEAKTTRRWRQAAEGMGFEFDGYRTRYPFLTRFFLPKILFPGTTESVFCYGEALQTLRGTVQGMDLTIADFTVWNLYSRGALAYRAVLCVVESCGLNIPGQIGLVKHSSILLQGFRLDRLLRQYLFPQEKDFSRLYSLFGLHRSPPWLFSPDIRQFCVQSAREIDCIWISENALLVVWTDKKPERFPDLVQLSLGIMAGLVENLPENQRQSRSG